MAYLSFEVLIVKAIKKYNRDTDTSKQSINKIYKTIVSMANILALNERMPAYSRQPVQDFNVDNNRGLPKKTRR